MSFVPARVELLGESWSPRHPLSQFLQEKRIESPMIRPRENAIWVRGRVTRIFGVTSTPEDERPEKTLSYFGFAAVMRDGDVVVAIPFECSDY